MEDVSCGDGRGARQTGAITAMPQRRPRRSPHAIFAGAIVAKQNGVRASETVVMHGVHNRNACTVACPEDARAQQRKIVVHVNEIGGNGGDGPLDAKVTTKGPNSA